MSCAVRCWANCWTFLVCELLSHSSEPHMLSPPATSGRINMGVGTRSGSTKVESRVIPCGPCSSVWQCTTLSLQSRISSGQGSTCWRSWTIFMWCLSQSGRVPSSTLSPRSCVRAQEWSYMQARNGCGTGRAIVLPIWRNSVGTAEFEHEVCAARLAEEDKLWKAIKWIQCAWQVLVQCAGP